MFRKGNFRFGIYTFNDDHGYSWLVIGLLALQIKLRPKKGRYGLHLTRAGLFIWWGIHKLVLDNKLVPIVLKTTQLTANAKPAPESNYSVSDHHVTIYNGPYHLRMRVYGFREVEYGFSWLPGLVWRKWIVDLAQDPQTFNPEYKMHMVYVSSQKRTLGTFTQALRHSPDALVAMEDADGFGGVGCLRYRPRG
ncbi:hypothetical protein pEaSNUABM54_00210 [Erwinia phage pEa_SNUABM_54]|nr:hypothetical protein pEaSNUABM54_00210 [Erwinia phage pEa_SNUABM_54]